MTTIDVTKARVAKSGNIVTPKGRFSYAQFLIEAKENKQGKKKYNLNLLVPPNYDFTELKKAMGKVALEKCDGDKNRAKKLVEKRFLDPNNLPGGGKPAGEEFEGWVLVRASSDYKPKFAYPNGKEIPNEELEKELYSGRWGLATLNPYWSNNEENKGVFLGLQNVQLLDHDETLGGQRAGVEDDFEAVDDFESDEPTNKSTDDVDDMF